VRRGRVWRGGAWQAQHTTQREPFFKVKPKPAPRAEEIDKRDRQTRSPGFSGGEFGSLFMQTPCNACEWPGVSPGHFHFRRGDAARTILSGVSAWSRLDSPVPAPAVVQDGLDVHGAVSKGPG
jgi:hypothetical protein